MLLDLFCFVTTVIEWGKNVFPMIFPPRHIWFPERVV